MWSLVRLINVEAFWDIAVTKTKEPISARIFSTLAETLENGIDIHRCVAAAALADIAYPGTAAALKKGLLDEDEDVRTDVVNGLQALKDPETADAVMENLLGDPCPEVKLAAIEMLAEVNYRPAAPWLQKLVVSASEDINWDHDGYYTTGWEDWLDIQVAAINAIGKMAITEAVPEILIALADEEGQDLSQIAIPVLAKLGDDGLKALEDLFAEGDAQTRRRICDSLSLGQSPRADELISACLQDQDSDVRYVALEKQIAANSKDPKIIGFYNDPSEEVRQLVVESIGARVPAKINELLSDPSPLVRQAAFRAIAAEPERFEKDGFSEIVRKAIAGVPEVAGDASVAWAALIGAPSADSLGTALQNPAQPLAFRVGLIEALTLLDDAGFPYLAEAAGDENRQVRVSAMTAIAEIAKETAWPNDASETLLAALNGDLVEPTLEEDELEVEAAEETAPIAKAITQDPEEKEALSTLDQILQKGIQTEQPADDDEAEEETVELTGEDERFIEISQLRAMKKGKVSLDVKIAPYQDVRRFAARLLGDFNEGGLTVALAEALAHDDDELKQACLESLALIGLERNKLKKSLYKLIVKETESPDRGIRIAATRCIGFMPGDNVTERLVGLSLEQDVHVRMEAINALGKRKGQTETMITALQDDYSGVRSAAAKSLAGAKIAMDELISLTFKYDGMHRQDIVKLLKSWNPNEAGEKYFAIFKDEERKRDWLVAIQALGDLFAKPDDENIQAVA